MMIKLYLLVSIQIKSETILLKLLVFSYCFVIYNVWNKLYIEYVV